MKPASLRTRFLPAFGLAMAMAGAWTGLPALAEDPPTASQTQGRSFGVLLADHGGLDPQTARTLRTLTVSELRKQGFTVSDDPSWEGLHPAGAATQDLVKRFGGRVLALRVAGRLGAKVPLILEELRADGSVATSTSLTAGSLEECDIVIPRLVEALLAKIPVEDTARMTTVTTEEARPFQHRPGEGRFVIGVLNPLFSGDDGGGKSGLSLGYMFETEHFLVGVEGLYTRSGNSNLGSMAFLHGAWLPLNGEFSPYLGIGIGYLGGEDRDVAISSGMGYKVTAGLEMFRLHRLRIMLGVDVYFPSSRSTGTRYHYQYPYYESSEVITTRSNYPVIHVKLAF